MGHARAGGEIDLAATYVDELTVDSGGAPIRLGSSHSSVGARIDRRVAATAYSCSVPLWIIPTAALREHVFGRATAAAG